LQYSGDPGAIGPADQAKSALSAGAAGAAGAASALFDGDRLLDCLPTFRIISLLVRCAYVLSAPVFPIELDKLSRAGGAPDIPGIKAVLRRVHA
jgi:hypothetical protein